MLRKNQARTRYWLWLMASMKFLIPFSLLVGLGSHLTPPNHWVGVEVGSYAVMEEMIQPFTQVVALAAPKAVATVWQNLIHTLPAVLAAMWVCGFVWVLRAWTLRRRGVYAAMRAGTPLSEGREAEALRRMERAAEVRNPIALLLSQDSLEPGVFGIFRPVLLWPQQISQRLDDSQLEAILAHETWHVRRRDNLTAALHMAVEAIFWFHPLVWWMERRLVEERERACDEEVLRLCGQPEVYAESILKVCEFCVESPLVCVSGVTGADLKKRIVFIMTKRAGDNLSSGRKLLLVTLGITAVVGPVAFGVMHLPAVRAQLLQSPGPLPTFEVATVKATRPGDPGGGMRISFGSINLKNQRLDNIVKFAYNVSADAQLSVPQWVHSARYDINAKAEDSAVAALEKMPPNQKIDQIRLMLQALLAERFKMKASVQARQLPVYALLVTRGGAKLTKSTCGTPCPNAGTSGRVSKGEIIGKDAEIQLLIEIVSRLPELGGRTILDETGLKDKYDWTMHWTPADSPASNEDASEPSLFRALEEQMGLKLQPTKGPVQVLVVDHIDQPSEN
jgi:bla regulator protein BlaR1